MAQLLFITPGQWPTALTAFVAALLLPVALALAVPMQNDPKGFEGIPWGASFSESDTFVKVEDTGRVQTYELKSADRTLGSATVDSMKFSTVDRKFARVMVRYSGKEAHDRILSYLQERFGPLDQTPGQVAGGAVKFFNWQGDESEIILRYDLRTSQGVIFFESEAFRAKFNEGNSPSTF
ncbi:MAG TPA: hypothetical protein PKN47_17450 [Nitrospira sp.]|jgi:hypothetical protein|nr:hypothetical protein [Nitrospira sp.]HRB15519.1 hypothetical protein [Nitrospira sp.]